jgi:hypothetical protein
MENYASGELLISQSAKDLYVPYQKSIWYQASTLMDYKQLIIKVLLWPMRQFSKNPQSKY